MFHQDLNQANAIHLSPYPVQQTLPQPNATNPDQPHPTNLGQQLIEDLGRLFGKRKKAETAVQTLHLPPE